MSTLTKVDSAVAGLPSPAETKKTAKKETTKKGANPDVMNIKDLGMLLIFHYTFPLPLGPRDSSCLMFLCFNRVEEKGIELQIAIETQKLNW